MSRYTVNDTSDLIANMRDEAFNRFYKANYPDQEKAQAWLKAKATGSRRPSFDLMPESVQRYIACPGLFNEQCKTAGQSMARVAREEGNKMEARRHNRTQP